MFNENNGFGKTGLFLVFINLCEMCKKQMKNDEDGLRKFTMNMIWSIFGGTCQTGPQQKPLL